MMKAIILAGGKNKRIGLNKALIRLSPGGQTIIESQIKILQKIFPEVLIVTNSPQEYQYLGVEVIKDIVSGKGPLGGIYSGLFFSESFHNFFLACDMPFPNLDLIAYMKGLVDDYDIVIPRTESGYESLCAFYSKSCLAPVRGQIDSGILRIIDFFSQMKVRAIKAEELKGFDPSHISFFNINTGKDLEKARSIAISSVERT